MIRIRENLSGKILDLTDPGWRERPLMAKVLAHQQRIRSDPEVQARRRKVHEESVREIRWMSTGLLLLPLLGWSLYALCASKPWNLALNSTVGTLYATWATGVVILYAVRRVEWACSAAGLGCQYGLVEYVEPQHHGEINSFTKQSGYSWQSECRIAVDGIDADTFRLKIGSLKDVAEIGAAQEVFDSAKLYPVR